MVKKKKLFLGIFISLFILFVFILLIDPIISISARGRIYRDLVSVPPKDVAVVLGTAKYAPGGINMFYQYRLEAARELFQNGMVRAIIVSGDNSVRRYNEPGHMKKDLIALGIPEEYITCDYAGFRTLDSIVRVKEIFGFNSYIIVSQRFHCQRAVFIALNKGHDPVAFAATDVKGGYGMKIRIREFFARIKAFIDVYILNTQPKFLGNKEQVILKD